MSGLSSDGLSTDEKTNIMFKKYMNFASTGEARPFTTEDKVKNNNTVFQDSIMNTKPEINTTYTALRESEALTKLSDKGFNVDSTWYTDNLDDTNSKFEFDTNNPSVLRFNLVKLQHIADVAAFACFDNSGVNILENLKTGP